MQITATLPDDDHSFCITASCLATPRVGRKGANARECQSEEADESHNSLRAIANLQ